MFRKIIAAIFLISMICGVSYGQTKACDELSGSKKAIALKIMNSQHPYSCCDSTILKCVEKENPCDVALRLADSICKDVAKGEKESKIIRGLELRAKSMNPYGRKFKIDLNGLPVAGEKNAPVTVVVYACARCPYCSKLVPMMYDVVTKGALKGKVKLYFKAFPLKSHKLSKEGGLAMLAALKLGHFWNYVLKMYSEFDNFTVDKLYDWAKIEGMDSQKFKEIMNSEEARNELVASKKEGLANKVDATPQIFINNRRYYGFLNIGEVADVLEEEYNRVVTKK
ncbi:MAG: thioredoxin domain-containing protein [Deltaproteobacteria bacterium]|nr:thioredoxin domain-containing protein [Deltaproteobacteria bacterium]